MTHKHTANLFIRICVFLIYGKILPLKLRILLSYSLIKVDVIFMNFPCIKCVHEYVINYIVI